MNRVLGSPEYHNNELLYNCPNCEHHKKKLSVNLMKGVFKCWVCEFSGKNLAFLIKKYGNQEDYIKWGSLGVPLSADSKEVTEDKATLRLPEEFITLCTVSPQMLHSAPLNYLKKRGVTLKEIYRWKMGFCYRGRYRGRLIIPSFDTSGELSYFIARSYDGNNIKYLNPPTTKDVVFNDLMVDWSKPITLVEGIFDALKLENAIPILGSTLPTSSKLFQKILDKKPRVYMALDNDAQKKEEKIMKDLLLYGVELYKMSIPSGHDLGDLSKEECANIKQKANFVDGTDYLLYQKIFSEAL